MPAHLRGGVGGMSGHYRGSDRTHPISKEYPDAGSHHPLSPCLGTPFRASVVQSLCMPWLAYVCLPNPLPALRGPVRLQALHACTHE